MIVSKIKIIPVPSGIFFRSIKPKLRSCGVFAISTLTGKVFPSSFVIVNGSSSSNVYTFFPPTSSTISSFGSVFKTSDTWFNSSSIPSPVTVDILYISIF